MKVLTHDNMDMRGKATVYHVHDEHHGVEVLETRTHPNLRLQGHPNGGFLVCRVRVRPWNVVCWMWADMVPPHHMQASYVRLCNQAAIRSSRS